LGKTDAAAKVPLAPLACHYETPNLDYYSHEAEGGESIVPAHLASFPMYVSRCC